MIDIGLLSYIVGSKECRVQGLAPRSCSGSVQVCTVVLKSLHLQSYALPHPLDKNIVSVRQGEVGDILFIIW